jgi:hypothetical protein
LKLVFLICALLMAIFIALLIFLRFFVVPREGYPTWEAARNILVRDGEIVIVLPDEMAVLDARCDHPECEISIDGQIVTTKVGYSSSAIVLDVEIRGQRQVLRFAPKKLNNWNRIRFEPVDLGDPFSEFRKIENGLEESHLDFSSKKGEG